MLREEKRNESRISRSSGLEQCLGALKLAQERIASSPIYWQEFGYLVSTLDMNSWRWQINGSIISAVCHQCDSKCYSNEAVIIVKLRGSILSKGRVQGKRWRGDYKTRGQSLKTKGYSAYLKHLLEARLPIHHALNNPSQLKQRQMESSHQSSTQKIIREVYSPVHLSATKTCSCDPQGWWWGTSHSRVTLVAPQPQARAQLHPKHRNVVGILPTSQNCKFSAWQDPFGEQCHAPAWCPFWTCLSAVLVLPWCTEAVVTTKVPGHSSAVTVIPQFQCQMNQTEKYWQVRPGVDPVILPWAGQTACPCSHSPSQRSLAVQNCI